MAELTTSHKVLFHTPSAHFQKIKDKRTNHPTNCTPVCQMIMQSQGETMTCSVLCASREPEALGDVVNSLCCVLALSKESKTLVDLRFLSHALCVLVRLAKAFLSVLGFNKQANRDYTVPHHSAHECPLTSPPANQILLEVPWSMSNLSKPDDDALPPKDTETWVHSLTSKGIEGPPRLLKIARSNFLVCVETHIPLLWVTVGAISITNLGHYSLMMHRGQKP